VASKAGTPAAAEYWQRLGQQQNREINSGRNITNNRMDSKNSGRWSLRRGEGLAMESENG